MIKILSKTGIEQNFLNFMYFDKKLKAYIILNTERLNAFLLKTDKKEKIHSHYFNLWRRKWHPTLLLLPGKSHGRRSLVGCSP